MKKSNEKEITFIGVLLQTLISIVAIGVAFHFGGLIPAAILLLFCLGVHYIICFLNQLMLDPK